jgi:hypothetical protein
MSSMDLVFVRIEIVTHNNIMERAATSCKYKMMKKIGSILLGVLLKMLRSRQFYQEASWVLRGQHEARVIRPYHITGRDDYSKYNKLCGMVTKLVSIIKKLDPKDPSASR